MSSKAPRQRNELLAGEIRRAIGRAGGRIPFRDYMELALYHPTLGYYSAPGTKTGKAGDYRTSPELSPLFGQTLRRWLEEQFAAGAPRRVLEIGAGSGHLAAELGDGLEYLILERSDDFRRRQRELLGERAAWVDAVPQGFAGVVLSNELLDALPVHRLVRDRERYVRVAGDGFEEELGPYSTPSIAAYFERLDLSPAGEAEVSLDAVRLMGQVYERLTSGAVLTIDYGYEARELFLGHPQGTFMTYRRHSAADEPYSDVGSTDMTSHVDFTTLMAVGEAAGLSTEWFGTQADFLARYGIGELLVARQSQLTDAAAYYALRQEAMQLLDPAGLGAFRVLVQRKA